MLRCGGAAIRSTATLPTGPAEAFLRPHRVRLLEDQAAPPPGYDNLLEARLTRRIYTGETIALETETAAGPVTAELQAGQDGPWRALAPGAPLRLAFRAADLAVFPAP